MVVVQKLITVNT
ncbi:hypothetical protein FWK35_00030322 [Aphis craccivora]|uniref:Uncharacterized protein n=1 Tax=Aphis craccivora TaxID=307492 RepID=A0A6G0YRW5_APHCR|nr:hypothetical protein FWK35_00030322 [Aphis craccivora]